MNKNFLQKLHKNSILNALICGTLLIPLSSCSLLPEKQQTDINISEIEKPILVLPKKEPLTLKDIQWKVITSDNSEQVFQELEDNYQRPVLFAITPNDYKVLSQNFADIIVYIRQQDSILSSYERYYMTND